jgi:hypothetical protein
MAAGVTFGRRPPIWRAPGYHREPTEAIARLSDVRGFVTALAAAALAVCASGCAPTGGCADGPAVLDVRLSAPSTALDNNLTSITLCLEGGWCETLQTPFRPGYPVPATARYWLSFSDALSANVAGPGSAWPKVALHVTAYSGPNPVVRAGAWGSATPIACQQGNDGKRPAYRITAWLDANGTFVASMPPLPVDPPGVNTPRPVTGESADLLSRVPVDLDLAHPPAVRRVAPARQAPCRGRVQLRAAYQVFESLHHGFHRGVDAAARRVCAET